MNYPNRFATSNIFTERLEETETNKQVDLQLETFNGLRGQLSTADKCNRERCIRG